MGRPKKERRKSQAARLEQSDDALWTIERLANYLALPVATIYQWRYRGKGPVGHRVGKHLRFRKREIDLWLETQKEVRGGAY